MKPQLTLKDVRPQLPFNINYGMADISIKHILDPNWGITLDWDVYLPTKGMNLQRPLVWTLQQKQELIYSIFKGIQLPPISVIQYRDDNKNITYRIIDGKQRLSTIIAFVKNEFPILWNQEEYLFDELDHSIKGEFLYHGLIRSNMGYEYPDQPISDDDKIKWFQMINFAGTPQDKEHMDKLLNMNQFTYQGYMSKEAEEFFKDNLIEEQRDGLAVMGFWVKTADGNTHMLEKGLSFIKDKKGLHLLFELQ